jgi:hypothetical protein
MGVLFVCLLFPLFVSLIVFVFLPFSWFLCVIVGAAHSGHFVQDLFRYFTILSLNYAVSKLVHGSKFSSLILVARFFFVAIKGWISMTSRCFDQNRNSVVGIATSYGLRGSSPGGGKNFHPDRLWG